MSVGNRILIVGNPSSRGGQASKRIEQTKKLLEERGIPFEFRATRPNRETVSLVADAIAGEGFRTVVFLGGDGTFYEVATGICQSGLASEVRLGMLPSGTANDQGKSFGVSSSPRALKKNIDTIIKGCVTKLDVGEVTAISESGVVLRRDLFYDSLGFGLFASILALRNRDVKKTKSVPVIRHMYRNHVVYLRAALRELAVSLVSGDRFTAEVEVDDEKHELTDLTDLLVKNTLIFAGDWIVDIGSRHDDGMVEVSPFRGMADWTSRIIVNHKKFPLNRDAMERIGISSLAPFRGKLVKVRLLKTTGNESVPCELDGEEFVAAKFFEIKVHPRLLSIIVPEEPHWI